MTVTNVNLFEKVICVHYTPSFYHCSHYNDIIVRNIRINSFVQSKLANCALISSTAKPVLEMYVIFSVVSM